jgi:hypothetical protein
VIYNINNFSEIDFVNIDIKVDRFILPDGKEYHFSDFECDYCNAGGTVLESLDEPKKYFCVLCNHELSWKSFINDFIPPTGDAFNFLLPQSWNQLELDEWFDQFKRSRLLQEEVRKKILVHGKG